ncbi:MAG: dual specificity protein phosphatase family protein [Chloroflexota bacterium]
MDEEEIRMPLATPFADSYWVIPGRLLAGEYPGAKEEQPARKKILSLLQSGIRAIINLTEAGELVDYHAWLEEEAEECGMSCEVRRMSIADLSTPTEIELIRILDQIDTWLSEGKNVYVHCWGGIGRTGTVIGCYLVRKGMPPEAALRQIAQLRRGTPDGWKNSPETEEQRQMVLNWRAGK